MEKKNLRKVEYGSEKKIMYFHGWIVINKNNGGDQLYAIVETEDGQCGEVLMSNIRFIE